MKQLSKNFKKLFLLYFTRELIIHSNEGEFLRLQRATRRPIQMQKELNEEFMPSIKTKSPKRNQELQEKDLDFSKVFKGMKQEVYKQIKTLAIPETKLPQHLQYLKPTPKKIKIDLEKERAAGRRVP